MRMTRWWNPIRAIFNSGLMRSLQVLLLEHDSCSESFQGVLLRGTLVSSSARRFLLSQAFVLVPQDGKTRQKLAWWQYREFQTSNTYFSRFSKNADFKLKCLEFGGYLVESARTACARPTTKYTNDGHNGSELKYFNTNSTRTSYTLRYAHKICQNSIKIENFSKMKKSWKIALGKSSRFPRSIQVACSVSLWHFS